jgi:hypothetical protein
MEKTQLFSEDSWIVHCLSLSMIGALTVMHLAPIIS